MRRIFTLLVLLTAAFALASCSSTSAKEQPIAKAQPKPAAPAKSAVPAKVNYEAPKKSTTPETVKAVQPEAVVQKAAPVEQKADTPSPSLVAAYIESEKMIRFIARGDRFFKITKLEKTNGISNSFLGAVTYRMEYKVGFECLGEGPPRVHWDFNPIPCETAGELISGTGFVDFEKTENGWRVIEQAPGQTDWFTPKRNTNS